MLKFTTTKEFRHRDNNNQRLYLIGYSLKNQAITKQVHRLEVISQNELDENDYIECGTGTMSIEVGIKN